jgi:hypothetical protein
MTGNAGVSTDRTGDPLRLVTDVGRDAVALRPGAGEIVRAWNAQQREPVLRRKVLGGRLGARCRQCHQVQHLPWLRLGFWRVHEAVAAHPHVVAGLRQVRHQKSPLVVGDDDPGKARRQIGGLSNHPHPCLGTTRTGDGTADVVGVGGDGRTLSRKIAGGEAHEQRRHHHGHSTRIEMPIAIDHGCLHFSGALYAYYEACGMQRHGG